MILMKQRNKLSWQGPTPMGDQLSSVMIMLFCTFDLFFFMVAVLNALSTDDASPTRTSQLGDENPAG